MEQDAVYLVFDHTGYSVVYSGDGGSPQVKITGPWPTVDEAIRNAYWSRNAQPVAVRLHPA